jgi:hypothetical protein
LSDVDAATLVRAPRATPLLTGDRGGEGIDFTALENLVLRVSVMVDEHPELASIVLDPVLTSARGLAVLGAHVRVHTQTFRDQQAARKLAD